MNERSIWTTRRAAWLHLTLAVTVPGFLILGWWQLHRALGGNNLSWAYTFEWPFFAGYAVYLWWRLVHEPDGEGPPLVVAKAAGRLARFRRPGTVANADEDAALADYNAHLASLHAADRGRHAGHEADESALPKRPRT